MKFSTQVSTLFLLAGAVSALRTTGHGVAHVRGLSLAQRQAEPPVIEREECTRIVQDGIGNVNRETCQKNEEGVDGCTCRIRRTQVRCSRAVQDGIGNVNIETCQQNEEGVDGCSCGETTATRRVIRCSRAVQDGIGNVTIERCERNEEGVDGCSCGETTDIL